jgi:hypothetical protein
MGNFEKYLFAAEYYVRKGNCMIDTPLKTTHFSDYSLGGGSENPEK